MMTLKEEDELAEKLSALSPLDYSSLMRKVRRWQWDLSGPTMFDPYAFSPYNRIIQNQKPQKRKYRRVN